MSRLLWAIRNTYNTKRVWYVVAFCAIVVTLYCMPYSLFRMEYNSNPAGRSLFYDFAFLDYSQPLPREFVLHNALAFCLLIVAIASSISSIKVKPLFVLSLPFVCYCIYAQKRHDSIYGDFLTIPEYSAFYIFLCSIVICFVALILLALYLPLKEPKPREPRKRKPSKAQRIAELEARVQELEKESRD